MEKNAEYFLVNSKVLPEIFLKVVEAKRLLAIKTYKTVNEVVKELGISRSAFYKYKDCVFPFNDITRGKVVFLYFVVENISGILSKIINEISNSNANILTINQAMPVNGLADITISVDTINMNVTLEELFSEILKIDGLSKYEILARE